MPTLKPREVVSALTKAGFIKARQTGSHLIMKNQKTGRIVPVPIHAKSLKRGLLSAIIKEADLTSSEFLKLLKRHR
ncbi:MAG: type II toxin-antitoxin system HicA family toxin [Candidatus Levybacteria bacterium]|nr:type II toxin-antitoxin system HicA family toxin [Candidatus Levybacteria bacterium]